ncbi:glucoamylase family protein [Fictibacillus terranigra]|uniref:Glucoamylase family protein n=1 Tax=Fictibacillus terranigra TaxID=3058424 RepID=A0ABT8E809_9BACL|nr:glucoamylase family protein [Fictibacillus sp. CENA-BCM004]MDN4074035.1 glucoamylase family protein [Fictibacillus sp. CENA-BCM004]
MNGLMKLMMAVICVFFTVCISAPAQASTLNQAAFKNDLKAIAKSSYSYFVDYTDPKTGLTSDAMRFPDGKAEEAKHTSPTNISMYLLSTISAQELGFITRKEAVQRIRTTLHTLDGLKKWNGLFYNWYNTDGSLKTDWGQFISQVDNGWLTAGLMTAGQAYNELYPLTSKLVNAMNYTTLYDPEVGQFRGGYDVVTGKLTDHHYGMFYTEPRLGSYIAIGKGDVPKEHWWKMFRTLPSEWDWQSQIPMGPTEVYDGVSVFEGHYEYNSVKYVPSWGGSMFEGLMPGLVLNEKKYGKDALGLNNARHVHMQMAFAKEKGYPAWGFSPAATPEGYSEFAATPLGTSGYKDDGTVTAHASFLALDYAPAAVHKNLDELRKLHAYGKYGFFDSVNVKSGEVTKAYLALDQGMIIVSIANHVKKDVIRNYFHHDPIAKKPVDLLRNEKFSIQ